MGKGTITKVMKYTLHYIGGCGDFYEMQHEIWALQRQTREILNKTIQIAFDWDYRSSEAFRSIGNYLDIVNETGYKRLDGFIYNRLKDEYNALSSSNLNVTIQTAWKKYTSSRSSVMKGEMSIPSYKKDQPLLFHKDSVRFSTDKYNVPAVELTTFSNVYKKAHGQTANPVFEVLLQDGTQRSIFQRILNKIYSHGQCQLVYQKKKWFLYLTYSFDPEKHDLDSEKILGVDIGEALLICASSVSERGRFQIDGGEVSRFAAQIESRKRALQRQAKYCGEGRIGHGTRTRVLPVYKTEDIIANYRDTINHKYSKALIDYAIKHQFGVIQMEDLTKIKDDTGYPKFLRHWTYYDLQNKIEAKAKEHGIKVIKINPKYTSQRCSKCGHISKANRKDQANFCCEKCGFTENADYNASQNISIKDIDDIIAKETSAKPE